LIALFDKDDGHHAAIKRLLHDTAGRLITTWPVVTETSHMLDFDARAQLDFYRWVAAGGVVVHEVPQEALGRIIELVEKYGDRPMDLADATLVVAAEALGTAEIVSIDRDFEIYRIAGSARFQNLYVTSE
jgi:predicted nucleic acid-binding protein